MTLVDTLAQLLRPAGGGVHLVSTGKAEQDALQRRLYGAGSDGGGAGPLAGRPGPGDHRARRPPRHPVRRGRGLQRGANLGPSAIRAPIAEDHPGLAARLRAAGLVDLGDVFVVPQLLHDDMLSEAQKDATRRALYPALAPAEAAALPVSPLSIAERALGLASRREPARAGRRARRRPLHRLAGGEGARRGARRGSGSCRSTRTPISSRSGSASATASAPGRSTRTSSLGRGGRLVQVGTRASGHDRAHWESTLGVRQLWAEEVRRDPGAALDAIVGARARPRASTAVYFSNDIDGTDAAHADATGTPEPGGLDPDFVVGAGPRGSGARSGSPAAT